MMIEEGTEVNYIQSPYEREFSITIDYGETTDSLQVINLKRTY